MVSIDEQAAMETPQDDLSQLPTGRTLPQARDDAGRFVKSTDPNRFDVDTVLSGEEETPPDEEQAAKEPGAEPEAQKPAPSEQTTPIPALTAEQWAKVQQLGVNPQILSEFEDAESVASFLDILERGRIPTLPGIPTGLPGLPPAGPPGLPPVPPQGVQGQAGAYQPYKLPFEDSDYDDGMLKTIRGLDAHVGQQIGALQQVLQQQQQANLGNMIDALVSNAGQQHQPTFGAGPSFILDPASPQAQNRIRLRDAVVDIGMRYVAAGVQPPPIHQVFNYVLSSFFGQQQGPPGPNVVEIQKLTDQLNARKAQSISRATNRQAAPLKGPPEKRAAIAVKNKMAELGLGE